MQEAEQSQDSPGPVATPPPNGILSDMTIVIRNRVHHDLDYHHHHSTVSIVCLLCMAEGLEAAREASTEGLFVKLEANHS